MAADIIKQNLIKTQISALDASIADYNGRICQINQMISNTEKSFNALVKFKNSVVTSQDVFYGANGSKSSALNEVKSVAVNNTVAKVYSAEMEKILKGSGTKIATRVYSFLINSINAEMQRLKNLLREYEGQINQYNSMISSAQSARRDRVNELNEMEGS